MGGTPHIRSAPPFRPGPGPAAPPRDLVIPFEQAAVFEITGRPGNVLQDVITVSPDGAFVATAIGYGFEEERGRDETLQLQGTAARAPGDVRLGEIPPAALIEGFRLSPASERVALKPAGPARRERELSDEALPVAFLASSLLQRVRQGGEISFLFSMLDSATGRELQDEPAHNLASLGKSNGERPFRPLARPLSFAPRSTLRLQVVEGSEGLHGRLHVVLFGYKILGAAACPEPAMRAFATAAAPPPPGRGERIVPFDYVMTFPLSGRPGERVTDEIAINVEGGFVAETLGYGLATAGRSVPLLAAVRRVVGGNPGDPIVLGQVPLKALPTNALVEGLRIRPDMVRLAFGGGGNLTGALREDLADSLFESLNRPDDASFLYTLFDTGTGRELQNRPIHNVAGLGIATGDRPFKRFARPLVFQPRATLRAEIEERFGRGTLYLVFQGYRLLGGGR